jgi:WD40 repeat protein
MKTLAQSQVGSSLAATAPGSTPSASRPQPLRQRQTGRTPTARRQPPWLIVVGAVIALLVVAGVVLHQLSISSGRSTGSKTAATGVTIVPSLHGLDCIQDAAWSLNSQQVALLGYGGQCPSDDPSNYIYQAGVLQIYSAVTGHMLHSVLPDAIVHALPDSPASPADVNPRTAIAGSSKTVLVYTHVQWSPDGSKLALTFTIMTWPGQGGIAVPAFRGIVLINADGMHERAAILREPGQQDSYFLYSALRWDTTSLSSLSEGVRQSYGPLISMPLGTGYSWSPDDHIIPTGSLASASSSTSAPVGDPDGGDGFTIWQPAILELFAEPEAPYVYTWYSSFLAWSPDGRYLIDPVSLRGLVHPVGEPTPTADELNAVVGSLTPPTMPIRDTAQQKLYVLLTKIAAGGNKLFGDIAWNPTGRILAAISDDGASDTTRSASSSPVTLYDSATGKSLATLQPAANTHASTNGSSASSDINVISLLRWSADGSHLLVYSDQPGTITIWGPSSLPASTHS